MDASLLAWFAELRSPGLDVFFRTLTWLGSLFLLMPGAIVLSLVVAFRYGYWHALLPPLVLLSTTALCFGLKLLVLRPRPALFASPVPMPADWSWPSAHAAQSMAVAVTCLLLIDRRRRALAAWVLLPLAGLVAVSRLYLQVHWPSDVIAGMLLGAACAWLGARLLIAAPAVRQ